MSDRFKVLYSDENELTLSIELDVKVKFDISITFSVYDGIDNDMVDMGRVDIETVKTYTMEAVATVSRPIGENISVINCEIEDTQFDVYLEDIEPDWI